MRMLSLVSIQGRTRVIPRKRVCPHHILHPEEYHDFWYGLDQFPELVNAMPVIPEGWRPLRLNEHPKRGDLIWWWDEVDEVWDWEPYVKRCSHTRMITKI